jgi:hypothetical protein
MRQQHRLAAGWQRNNELTAGGISILPSVDAIQEFKVLTYSDLAEWGTRAGLTENIIQPSWL